MTKNYTLLFILILLSVSCSQPKTTTLTVNSPTLDANANSGYPSINTQSSGYPQPNEPIPIEAWYVEVVSPATDKATLTGFVQTQGNQHPIFNVPVMLAEVHYEGDDGVYVLDGAFSPNTTTDSNGQFVFVNIEAKDYVIVVGNIEVNDYAIIAETEGTAQVWVTTQGETTEVGILSVTLSSWK